MCETEVDNKHLIVASCWFFLSLHTLLTMHGHRNLKLYRPGEALRVPGVGDSQISGQSAHQFGKFFNPTRWSPLPPGNIPDIHFAHQTYVEGKNEGKYHFG